MSHGTENDSFPKASFNTQEVLPPVGANGIGGKLARHFVSLELELRRTDPSVGFSGIGWRYCTMESFY